MKRRTPTLIAAAVLTASSLTGCSVFGGDDAAETSTTAAPDIRRVQPSEAEALIESDDVVVLDVRAPEEFATGHLADAENINYYDSDFADQLSQLDKNKTYVMYCQTGNRSAKVAQTMSELGFTDVAEIDGGISRWQNDGFSVDRG